MLEQLEGLPVNQVTRGFVECFMSGAISIQQLEAAIGAYLRERE